MSYSDGFKINVNKLNNDEMLLVLLEVSHPFLSVPVRLVNDNKDFVFNGNNFLAMPFKVKRQDDVQGELPKVSLSIPNVGRTLVKWIDSSGGGRNATMSIILSRRSTPNVIEEKLNLGIQSVSINTELVTFILIVQNNLSKRSMKFTYDLNRAPGLF